MDYYEILKKIYDEYNPQTFQSQYEGYLCKAINKIDTLWYENIQQFKDKRIKLIIFGEAPMWGDSGSYIYNNTDETSFFGLKHLNVISVLKKTERKVLLLEKLKELGIIFLDVSPFPFNPKNTSVCYSRPDNNSKRINLKNYKKIVSSTFEYHLKPKIEKIYNNNDNIPIYFIYRYHKLSKIEDILKSKFLEANLTFPKKISARITDKSGNIIPEELNKVLKIISKL